LSAGLAPLVWQAVDSDLDGRAALAARLQVTDQPAKYLIGDDDRRVLQAYAALGERPSMRATFQTAFARLDADRAGEISPAHRALAELLHRGHIAHIVSLNWDTLLETAHERIYGRRLVPDVDPLTKPHGDADRPDVPWVLPHQPGGLPENVAERLRGMADERPRVLLIAGYSERDAAIVEQLIGPLADRWRVIRVSPTAGGELDIPMRANEALTSLLAAIAPTEEVPGWEYVSFLPQRGIGPALIGEGLGPHEVLACPRLPEVAEVQSRLSITGSVTIRGSSGSGKSITAYQAGYAESRNGWEAVRLTSDGTANDPSLSLATMRHETLAIVDDAQALMPSTVRRIQDRADPSRLRVIIVTTERTGHGAVVELAAGRAVAEIAAALRPRGGELLPVLRALDPTLGEDYLDESFESRLATAASEETPWQFGFVLRGGWREARSAIAVLHDADRADLAVAALSACQLVTADRGVDRAGLERAVEPLGRSAEWLDHSIRTLADQHRLVAGPTLRTPHARFARTVLEVVLNDRADPERDRIVDVVRRCVQGDSGSRPSLVGVGWIVNALTFAGDLKWITPPLFDAALVGDLVDRFRAASPGRDVGAAAVALNLLRRWGDTATDRVRADPAWITQWISNADTESAHGLAALINDLYNDDRELAGRISGAVDVQSFVARMLNAEPAALYVWGEFLGRFWVAAPQAKRDEIAGLLDEPRVQSLISRSIRLEMVGTSEFLQEISAFDRPLALAAVESNAAAIAGRLSESPADGFLECEDVLWWVLGYAPRWLTRRRPDKEGRRIAGVIAGAVDPRRVASAIGAAHRRDWHNLAGTMFFLLEARRSQYQRVLDAISVDRLDAALAGYWTDPGRTLEEALHVVGWGRNHEPSRTLIARHANDLPWTFPRLAIFTPDVIAGQVRSGKPLRLAVESGHEWDVAVLALVAMESVDPEVAEVVVVGNLEGIARGLESLGNREAQGAAALMDIVHQKAPDGFVQVLGMLDTEKTASKWASLSREAADRAGVGKLIRLAEADPAGTQLSEHVRRIRKAPVRTGTGHPRTRRGTGT
jgi:hypothetical protein